MSDVLQETADGRTHISCEVAVDAQDPMTAKRMAILQPLSLMEGGTGELLDSGWAEPPQPLPPEPTTEVVESKLISCERCGVNLAASHAHLRARRNGCGALRRLCPQDVLRIRATERADPDYRPSAGWRPTDGASGGHAQGLAGARTAVPTATGTIQCHAGPVDERALPGSALAVKC